MRFRSRQYIIFGKIGESKDLFGRVHKLLQHFEQSLFRVFDRFRGFPVAIVGLVHDEHHFLATLR